MSRTDVKAWLAVIGGHSPAAIDLTLERVARVYRRLGAPRPGRRVVTIAGTNGKGSCAHFVARCLEARAQRVGLYTSPHLLRFNERMVVNGRSIDDAALCAAFAAVEAARGDEPLTFFEFTTLAAFVWFAGQKLDVAVQEVGLGGRLDAVNIVTPHVTVVTTIALDHQEYLGATRAAIALEKAGIFRPGVAAICGDRQAPAVLRQRARELGAAPRFRGREFDCGGDATHWWVKGEDYDYRSLPRPRDAPLAAFACGVEALARLGQRPERTELAQVLDDWRLPGRIQQVAGQPSVVLDVAHNSHAAEALARALVARPVRGATRAVIGMLADKGVENFVSCLDDSVAEYHALGLQGWRAQSAPALAARIGSVSKKPVTTSASVAGALARAFARSSPDDRLLVCGSFQVVGPALAWLGIYSGQHSARSVERLTWNVD